MNLILLHPDDNVLILAAALSPGDRVVVDGVPVTIDAPIGIGHKIARTALVPGDKVWKYGVPIGSMTRAAAIGAHIHLHNMQSDYLPGDMRAALERTSEP